MREKAPRRNWSSFLLYSGDLLQILFGCALRRLLPLSTYQAALARIYCCRVHRPLILTSCVLVVFVVDDRCLHHHQLVDLALLLWMRLPVGVCVVSF
jgi:hypothetical protein